MSRSSRSFRRALPFVLGMWASAHAAAQLAPFRLSWTELRTADYTLYCATGEQDARDLLEKLTSLDAVFELLIPELKINRDEPYRAFLFADHKDLGTAIPSLGSGGRDVAAAFLRTPLSNLIISSIGLDEDAQVALTLYHEFTHARLLSELLWLPAWAHEGIADYVSSVDLRRTKAEIGYSFLNYTSLLRREGLLPLQELFETDFRSHRYLDREARLPFYATSWLLTHMLLSEGFRIDEEFADYARRIEAGATADSAFAAAFPGLEEDVDDQLARYLRRPLRPVELQLPPPAAAGPEVELRTVPGIAVAAELAGALALQADQYGDDARRCFDGVVPGHGPRAQLMLALGAIAERDIELASALLDSVQRVPALDPDSERALGLALVRLGQLHERDVVRSLDEGCSEPTLRGRRILADRLERHPRDSWARVFYGSSFFSELEAPLDDAIAALELSLRAHPEWTGLRYELLTLHARRGEYDHFEAGLAELRDLDPEEPLVAWSDQALATEIMRRAYQLLLDEAQPDSAIALVDRFAVRDWQSEARSYWEPSEQQFREQLTLHQEHARYTQAYELARARRFDRAEPLLRELLANSSNEELKVEIQKLLRWITSQRR